MEAGKMADFYGCLPDHDCQQADAEQAYVQAELHGNETWVALPPEAWPAECEATWKNPVAGLTRALYGYPDNGAFWERHCEAEFRKAGCASIVQWPSCRFHRELQLFHTVDVDDLELSGPVKHLRPGWELIRERLRMGDPGPSHLYLGCNREKNPVTLKDGRIANAIVYNMEDYHGSAVNAMLPCPLKLWANRLNSKGLPPFFSLATIGGLLQVSLFFLVVTILVPGVARRIPRTTPYGRSSMGISPRLNAGKILRIFNFEKLVN
jgi:hypothetical protein